MRAISRKARFAGGGCQPAGGGPRVTGATRRLAGVSGKELIVVKDPEKVRGEVQNVSTAEKFCPLSLKL